MAGSGRVDDGIAIVEGSVAGEEAQALEHHEGLESRQRGGNVAESAALEHPARDGAQRHDTVDEGFEFAARGDRDEVEGGAICGGDCADRARNRLPPVEIAQSGGTASRQREREGGGDGALARAALAGNEKSTAAAPSARIYTKRE